MASEEIRRMRQKYGTTAQWAAADPTLALGEIAYEQVTGGWKVKLGDGVNIWSDLPYHVGGSLVNVVDATGSAYTLLDTDANSLVVIDDALTIPTGLPIGYSTTVFLDNATKKSITTTGLTVKGNFANDYISAEGVITLAVIASNTVLIAGSMES